jgi:hypothetical protein
MSEPTEEEPVTIECSEHGERTASIVCRHHLQVQDQAIGFVENSSDPDDLQAWCDQCEALFIQESQMTEEFMAFNGMAVVCVACYEKAKKTHAR